MKPSNSNKRHNPQVKKNDQFTWNFECQTGEYRWI
jgi:hypothetical protein